MPRPATGTGLKRRLRRFQAWVRLHIPFGLRLALGILLMLLGLVGFLPILGFWMIPLGIAIAALDVRPLCRRWRERRRPRD
ncbi:hypothetical protein [Pontibaca salina]|uniref:Uncharacterized protein n=1 Tax=Pontibaca salina TaxID=2795731 RepID=A0A934M3H2_9RHOB|nr:hypothetical protein [Pontibaca salina]MBI6629849.1 hypothetical protein [Pontibaca salina]